jgi:hypothetical protein
VEEYNVDDISNLLQYLFEQLDAFWTRDCQNVAIEALFHAAQIVLVRASSAGTSSLSMEGFSGASDLVKHSV